MLRPSRLVFVTFSCALAAQTNFPPPPAPAGNPVTTDKVLLGMALFFEEQLSSTDTVACATCHDFAHGGADGRAMAAIHPGSDNLFATADDVHGSPGVAALSGGSLAGSVHFGYGAQVTRRRAPTVINAAYHPALFYDGRAGDGTFRDPLTNQAVLTGNVALENLVLGPPVNPVEMGHQGRTWADVAQKLAAVEPLYWASQLPARLQNFVQGRTYPELFQQAFGSAGVTPVRIAMALASYLRTLNSDQSRWDLVMGNAATLNATELLGLSLFRTPRLGATSCHSCHADFESRVRAEGPIVGVMTSVPTGYYGAPQPTRLLFHNIGLRPIAEDPGRLGITGLTADGGRFRVASLRNVELTGPHFHNGSAATLADVIDFYDRGGDHHVNQAPNLLPRAYDATEKAALVAILRTLTDARVVLGIAPFDRPLIGSQNGRIVTEHGPGTSRSSGSPAMAHAPLAPRAGGPSFSVTLSGVAPGTFTMLMWDTAPRVPDPVVWNLGLLTGPGFLCVAIGPAATVASAPGIGVANVPLPLPAAARGLVLYCQWIAFEPSHWSGLVLSNSLRIEPW